MPRPASQPFEVFCVRTIELILSVIVANECRGDVGAVLLDAASGCSHVRVGHAVFCQQPASISKEQEARMTRSREEAILTS